MNEKIPKIDLLKLEACIRDNPGIRFNLIWFKMHKRSKRFYRPLDRALQKLKKDGRIIYKSMFYDEPKGWYISDRR